MNIKDISAAEALEQVLMGERKVYILKEMDFNTPAKEMMCVRFVVEVPEETEAQELQPQNSSGGGQSGHTRKEKEDAGLGKDSGAAQGWMVPCKNSGRDGRDGEHDCHWPVKIEKGGGREWEETER